MPSIDNWNLAPRVGATNLPDVRETIAREAWAWFEAHKDEEVLTVKVWFLSKRITVEDLRPVWIKVFGIPFAIPRKP